MLICKDMCMYVYVGKYIYSGWSKKDAYTLEITALCSVAPGVAVPP